MATIKKEFSATDAAPVILYVKTDSDSNLAYPLTMDMVDTVPTGAGSNGSVDLTSASTWYAVPSVVPTASYILIATIETAVGNVRFGFSNNGTPSASNGCLAPAQLTMRLAGSQSIFYGSSVAGDDVNWTTKVI